jgi:hypothetical protein
VDAEEITFPVGGVGQNLLCRQRRRRFIISQDVALGDGVGSGGYTFSIDLGQYSEITQDVRKLAAQAVDLGVIDAKACQAGNMQNFFARKFHVHGIIASAADCGKGEAFDDNKQFPRSLFVAIMVKKINISKIISKKPLKSIALRFTLVIWMFWSCYGLPAT